jgi:hypothetical protein
MSKIESLFCRAPDALKWFVYLTKSGGDTVSGKS